MHELGRYITANPDDPAISLDTESRCQHIHVIGQTGTGKSTLAKQSFMQDVYAGQGACYFDFHGEDAPWLLDRIPSDRIKDVVYVNPLNPSHVVGYNPLDGIDPADHATYTDEIVAALRHIHHASWGARMDDILTNAIRPLFDLPGESKGTLLGVVRMLNDPAYRHFVVGQCRDMAVKDFWQREYAEWSKNDKAHNLNSSLNKIRRFQSAPVLRHTLGQQRSRLRIGEIIAGGKLLILDLNKWRMGAVNANTLASLIVSRIIYEATRRPLPKIGDTLATSAVVLFSVVIDEFQSVTTLSMVEALSGIRKYRVSFLLSHQYIRQLERPVLDAIQGNIGTKIVFRIGGEDAETMQRHMDVAKTSDFAELPDYHFVAQFKRGNNTTVERGYTEPVTYKRYGHGAAIRSLMDANEARPVAELEAQYERWQETRHYGNPVRMPKRDTVKKKDERNRKYVEMKHIAAIMV